METHNILIQELISQLNQRIIDQCLSAIEINRLIDKCNEGNRIEKNLTADLEYLQAMASDAIDGYRKSNELCGEAQSHFDKLYESYQCIRSLYDKAFKDRSKLFNDKLAVGVTWRVSFIDRLRYLFDPFYFDKKDILRNECKKFFGDNIEFYQLETKK